MNKKNSPIETFAQMMLCNEIIRINMTNLVRKTNIEVTEEDKNKYVEDMREKAKDYVKKFQDKEEMYKLYQLGMLHPSNKITRQLFEGVTGIKLPKTVSGTKHILREYIGLDFIQQKQDEINQKEREQEKERQDKELQLKNAHKQELIQTIKNKEDITGSELVDLANVLGIYIHPRTVGYMRRKILSIQADGIIRQYGKGSSLKVREVYNKCRDYIEKNPEVITPQNKFRGF